MSRETIPNPKSIPSPSRHHHRHCLKQNLKIQPEGTVLDVIQIHHHHIVIAHLAAAANLPEAGHPWGNLKPPPVPLLHHLILEGQAGPGADEGHVALEHIEQLGQFIDAVSADNSADRGHPGIPCYLIISLLSPSGDQIPHKPPMVAVVGVDVHGPEFIPDEGPAVFTDDCGLVKYGSPGSELDNDP